MPVKRADHSRVVRVWSAGGFGEWLAARLVPVVVVALLVPIMLPALGHSGHSGLHPRVRVPVFQLPGPVLTADPDNDAAAVGVAEADYFVRTQPAGWPCTWSRSEQHSLAFVKSDPSIPDSLLRTVMVRHLAAHERDPDEPRLSQLAPFRSALATGDFARTEVLPLGIIVDVLAFCAGGGALLLVAAYTRRGYRACRQHARSLAGLCPECAYTVPDDSNAPCPECGHNIPSDA